MFDLQPKKRKPKKWIILAIVAVLVIVGVSFFGMRWWKDRQAVKYAASQTQNPQTEEGNASKEDESASNTYEQNKALAASASPVAGKVTLSTPLLMKSSGNNGPVPPGVEIEFTCAAQAGYSCKVVLSGAHSKTFENKVLKDNGRGQASVSWLWTAEKGQHSVKAVLSDGKGNEQESSAQNLEVKE